MAKPAPALEDGLTTSPKTGADLPDPHFIEGWRLITGEPPAILLDSRTEMLALLVESTPEAPLEPLSPEYDDPEAESTTR